MRSIRMQCTRIQCNVRRGSTLRTRASSTSWLACALSATVWLPKRPRRPPRPQLQLRNPIRMRVPMGRTSPTCTCAQSTCTGSRRSSRSRTRCSTCSTCSRPYAFFLRAPALPLSNHIQCYYKVLLVIESIMLNIIITRSSCCRRATFSSYWST